MNKEDYKLCERTQLASRQQESNLRKIWKSISKSVVPYRDPVTGDAVDLTFSTYKGNQASLSKNRCSSSTCKESQRRSKESDKESSTCKESQRRSKERTRKQRKQEGKESKSSFGNA